MSPAAPVPYSTVSGIAWPALSHPAGATMLSMQFQLERSQWWSRERLLDHQLRQLRVLADHAVANVPFYRDHLRRAGLAGAADLTGETYLRWPVLRRQDVQQSATDLAATAWPREHGEVAESYTSGSTGSPVRVLNSRVAQFFDHALVLRDHLWQQRDFSMKFGAIRLFASSGARDIWTPAINAAFRTGPAVVLDVSTDVDAQLDWLLTERPAYLLTPPSNLSALLARSAETGRRPQDLKQAITYAEALPDGLREEVLARWGAGLADAYSAREFGPIALQCPQAVHYHVQAENVLVEVLRDDGTPCSAGETGRVLVTALHNFPMPLMRYEIGDYAEAGADCECGRGLPVLKRIAGRVTGMATDPTGRRFWPGIRPSLLLRVAPIRQLRLLQHSASEIEMQYVMERGLNEDEARGVVAALGELLGYPYQFRLNRVTEIPRARGGKYEDFVSLLGRS